MDLRLFSRLNIWIPVVQPEYTYHRNSDFVMISVWHKGFTACRAHLGEPKACRKSRGSNDALLLQLSFIWKMASWLWNGMKVGSESLVSWEKFLRYHRKVWLVTSQWAWPWAHSVGGVTDKTMLEVQRLAKLWWIPTAVSQNYSRER